jgi:hypothetical protein
MVGLALKDHLEDPQTYKQLPEREATTAITTLAQTVESFIEEHNKSFTKLDQTYLYPSLEVEDPFPHFYITGAKVHKTPWKTRPIMLMSGIILHGLGKWVDRRLQPVCHSLLPTYLKSSYELKRRHIFLPPMQQCQCTQILTLLTMPYLLSRSSYKLTPYARASTTSNMLTMLRVLI